MRNQTPYLVYLDFLITIIGAFAIYSTNYIAYTNIVPIFETIYGIVIVTRGFVPLLLHREQLFQEVAICPPLLSILNDNASSTPQ